MLRRVRSGGDLSEMVPIIGDRGRTGVIFLHTPMHGLPLEERHPHIARGRSTVRPACVDSRWHGCRYVIDRFGTLCRHKSLTI